MIKKNLVTQCSKKDIIAWFAISFITFIAIGAYFRINKYIVSIYLLVCLPLCIINRNLIIDNLKKNKFFQIWLMYIMVATLSTVCHGRLFSNNSVFADWSFAFIALTLASSTNKKSYFQNFVKFMFLIGILVIFTKITNIELFEMLKLNSEYATYDKGVAALFEYRHYYGIMLVCSFFMNLEYGKKNKFIVGCVLLINISLTYTRNTWLAFAVGLMLYLLKKRNTIYKNHIIIIDPTKLRYIYLIVICIILSAVFLPNLWSSFFGNIIESVTSAKHTMTNYLYGGVRGYVLIFGVRYILENWKQYLLFGGGNGFALMWLKAHPYGTFKEWTAAIDVQYVTVLMNSGIIGLFFILWLIGKEICEYTSNQKNRDYLTALLVLVMCVAFFFFDVFSTCTSAYALWMIILCLQHK